MSNTKSLASTPKVNPADLCPEEFWFYKDDDYGIYFFNDHNNNLGVQVLECVTQRQQLTDGSVLLKKEKVWVFVEKSILIETQKLDANGKKQLIDPTDFERSCEQAVSSAKQLIEIQRMKRDRIKGFMLKKFPAVQKFNEPT